MRLAFPHNLDEIRGNFMKRLFAVLATGLFIFSSAALAQERKFTIDDLLKVRRVSDPQVSPKSDFVAFTITDVDKVANRSTTQIYLVPITGGEPRQLTNDANSSTTPRWSPDGERLAFVSARDGESQIWTIDVSSGTLKKVTAISTGASDPVWSPDGKLIAFASDIYPQCLDDACNKRRAEEASSSRVKAHVSSSALPALEIVERRHAHAHFCGLLHRR
jgi:Tol biopolymer transport system component